MQKYYCISQRGLLHVIEFDCIIIGNWSSVFENETTTNETKLFTACQQTENDICATTLEINIKQCSDGSYAYKLKPSPTNSSYCFGK